MNDKLLQVKKLLDSCTPSQRNTIFQRLRKEFPIHSIEAELNMKAEIILEAFANDKKGLTFRMMRGVLAQSAFDIEVIRKLNDWRDETPKGDLPYDFRLADDIGSVSVQVKLQRSKEFRPMLANEAYKRRFTSSMYVVETQKTRNGKDPATGQDTRSYRFHEFDVLAVAMQPSTNDWSKYMYTVGRWLIPDDKDPSRILKYQPIPMTPNQDWTDNFEVCINWFRSRENKTISVSA